MSNAFTTPFEEPLDKFYINFCKDNTVSTLGTLLKLFYKQVPQVLNEQVFNHWLSNLPLNNDKIEGKKQQAFLIDILEKDPSVIIKNAGSLKKVLEVFAKFISKRKSK